LVEVNGLQNPVFKLEKVVRSKSEEEMQDFEGPLDLILYLLGKNKMEIQDISISLICDQYMAWLARRQEMDLEVASEFVTMALACAGIPAGDLMMTGFCDDAEIPTWAKGSAVSALQCGLIRGVGTEGMAPYPAIDMFGNLTFVNQKVEIDEKVLKAISDMTGGRYFRATDKEKLKAVYDEINQLEKSKIEVMEHISYHELFLTWALAALGLLFAEFLLSNLVLKRIP